MVPWQYVVLSVFFGSFASSVCQRRKILDSNRGEWHKCFPQRLYAYPVKVIAVAGCNLPADFRFSF